MQTEKIDVVFFDTQTTIKIGTTNYVVKSFYDNKKEDLVAKIKHLLKTEIAKPSCDQGAQCGKIKG